MKKRIALLLALCLLLPCIALAETTAEVPAAKETTAETPVAAETAVEAALPTAYDVRYYFEQMLLPQLFYEYEDPNQFLGYLTENGVFSVWESFTGNNGFDRVYGQEDFAQNLYLEDDGILMMLVNLPKPEDLHLCNRVYLCLNPNNGKRGYYTVELIQAGEEKWSLGGRTEQGETLNYGEAQAIPEDPNDPAYTEILTAEMAEVLKILNTDAASEGSATPAADESGK